MRTIYMLIRLENRLAALGVRCMGFQGVLMRDRTELQK
jgi:hypothetical protein